MLNGIIIGIIIGLYLGWRLHKWWTKSSIKKAADVVGTATHKPGQAVKSAARRAQGLFSRLFSSKKDKEKP